MPHHESALAWPIAAILALLTGALSLPISADTASPTITPITSPHDARDYRVIRLENGLQTLLVSDPDADKAAASINVQVGSAQDPDDLQGLAHFLEHMLFLGTEAFPAPDAYQSYISNNAGSFNAFTAPQDTNYFFDIEPPALAGALDRFSAFFKSPLFNAEKLESERNIVHSEYMARIRDEARRENDVLNQVLNPDHPMTRFSVGSRETLADRPDDEPSLRQRVIDFYQQHYDSNVMTLAVVAPQPLDTLESMVVERFADLPDRGLTPAVIDQPLIDTQALDSIEALPIALSRHSLQSRRQVRFHFPLPDPEADYSQQPTQLISHLLGDESEGSLLAVLKRQGLADGLSAGVGRRDGNQALFTVSIRLTPEGAERLDDIQASLFAAIDEIGDNGIRQWRYQEQARLLEQAFRFQQAGAPRQEATRLAMSLSRYPAKDVQYAAYRMDEFDERIHRRYLGALRRDNLIRIYSGPDVEGDRQSPWFNTRWALDDNWALGKNSAETADPGRVLGKIRLPDPNPFIATDLELLSGRDDTPTRLMDLATMQAWHLQEDRFKTPRAEWRISLQHPSVSRSAEEAVLVRLLAQWLNDSLNEALYPARLAGHSMNAYAHSRGMTLAFSGWRDGQSALIERTLTQLLKAPISDESYERVHYQLQREWRNAPDASLTRQAQLTLGNALLTPAWSTDALLSASQRMERHHLEDFRQRFLSGLYVDAMAVGNLTTDTASEEASAIRDTLTPRLAGDAIATPMPLQVSSDETAVLHPDSQRDESLVLRYLQGADPTREQRAAVSVLAAWLQTPFYQQLRTEDQLGYIVNAGYSPLMKMPGLAMLVQSSDVDSSTIDEHMTRFMEDTDARLAALDEDTLAVFRQSVHDRLTERDTRLEALANRLWQATAYDPVNFDEREALAQVVLDISVEDIQSAWQGLRTTRLDIRFDPGDTPSDVSSYRDSLEAIDDYRE